MPQGKHKPEEIVAKLRQVALATWGLLAVLAGNPF